MCTVLSEFVFRVYKYTKLILILFVFVFRVYIGLYKCTKLILILCLCLGRSGRFPGEISQISCAGIMYLSEQTFI